MKRSTLAAGLILLAGGSLSAQTGRPQPNQSKNWEALMKHYPKRALAAGEQGLVAFRLTLDRNGQPTECQVTHSSGYKLLDNETCEVLLMHAEYKRPTDADGNNPTLTRTEGVINWRIPGGDTRLVSPVKVAKLDSREKRICKRTVRTGTLAGFERTCMTAGEWDAQRRESIEAAGEFQGKKGFTSGKD